MTNNIIVITGATCSGKSSIALRLAQALNAEIISADSAAIYRGLNIGTAKPTPNDLASVPHYMIDIVDPDVAYSVSDYARAVDKHIQDITARGKRVVIVGGTGLYIKSLLYTNSLDKNTYSPSVRAELEATLADKGKEYIYNILCDIDSKSASVLSHNDTRRVMRAIEIYRACGTPKSTLIANDGVPKYNFDMYVLQCNRDQLYNNISVRVDDMISMGLVDEVRELMQYKNCQSMGAIGYKELIEYLDGRISLDMAIELIKKNTRNYAKRQLTFFRALNSAVWITKENLLAQYKLV